MHGPRKGSTVRGQHHEIHHRGQIQVQPYREFTIRWIGHHRQIMCDGVLLALRDPCLWNLSSVTVEPLAADVSRAIIRLEEPVVVEADLHFCPGLAAVGGLPQLIVPAGPTVHGVDETDNFHIGVRIGNGGHGPGHAPIGAAEHPCIIVHRLAEDTAVPGHGIQALDLPDDVADGVGRELRGPCGATIIGVEHDASFTCFCRRSRYETDQRSSEMDVHQARRIGAHVDVGPIVTTVNGLDHERWTGPDPAAVDRGGVGC